MSEREILYKVLFEMKNDINNLKNILNSLTKDNEPNTTIIDQAKVNIEEKSLQKVEISQLNDYEITSDTKNQVFDESKHPQPCTSKSSMFFSKFFNETVNRITSREPELHL